MARRLGRSGAVWLNHWSGRSGWAENLSVRRGGRRCPCGACEPVSSMARRVATRTVDCCLEHELRLPNCLGPPRVERLLVRRTEGVDHEVIQGRCAGMDVSKRDAKVCVRIAGRGRRKTVETVRTGASTTNAILALREHLVDEQVRLVVMEATGDYWKPFYYLLEDAGFEVMLVNARQVKNLPGRKSDVFDAAWLAQLGAHGLVRGSLVPPAPIRELRDLTRARTMITRERGRDIQRLEKLLEDAGIKLSSVASDITGVSGRLMLQALIDGQRDPAVLADLAKRRLRHKLPELTEALTGRFADHHAFLARMYLEAIDQRSRAITDLTARIEVVIEPFRLFCNLIGTIPGIGVQCAEVIAAETGPT